jgi:hypothetical protein
MDLRGMGQKRKQILLKNGDISFAIMEKPKEVDANCAALNRIGNGNFCFKSF